MEKVISVFRSFEAADRADEECYQGLSPHECLAIMLDLNRNWPGAEPDGRVRRAYRIVTFARGGRR